MIFNEKEKEEIIKLGIKYPVISNLWEEYISYEKDPAKIYYTALTDAIIEISQQIKNKSLDVEDPYTKSILKLAETGDKVFDTLQRGKNELNKVIEEEDEQKNKKIKKGTDIAV